LTRYTFSFILLASAMVLTACGNKAAVKSEKPGQTVLEQATPISTESSSIQAPSVASETSRPVRPYAKRTSSSKTSATAEAPTAEAKTPEKPAPASVPARTPVTATEKKTGYTLPLILIALVLAGGGYYLWSKKSHRKNRPLPPHGGLSPVSGFTALKDRVHSDSPKKISFWSKKTL
jgi:hypothetical protein